VFHIEPAYWISEEGESGLSSEAFGPRQFSVLRKLEGVVKVMPSHLISFDGVSVEMWPLSYNVDRGGDVLG
jgi:hypothetical protein